jgi:predicted 3-demethylubiquinone-9 3-methyltransferase (glyoxalase superfamily)
MQKITPFLWFSDNNAEEAMQFYVSVFNGSPNKKEESKIAHIQRYPDGATEGPMKGMGGKVLTGVYELEGQRFMALDGGPGVFSFDKAAVSFLIECADQAEIDYFWGKLSAVPEAEQCGWCKDRFGVTWQITPANMGELVSHPGAMQAMMQMKKIDIAALQSAAKEA